MSKDPTIESWGGGLPVIDAGALGAFASEEGLDPELEPLARMVTGADAFGGSGVSANHRGLPSRNVVIGGKRTSIRLDEHGFDSLHDIARRERMSVNELCVLVQERNKNNDLTFTAALRIFMLAYYRKAATEEGHRLAGHGRGRPLAGTPFGILEEMPVDAGSLESRPLRGRAKSARSGRSAQGQGDEASPSGESNNFEPPGSDPAAVPEKRPALE